MARTALRVFLKTFPQYKKLSRDSFSKKKSLNPWLCLRGSPFAGVFLFFAKKPSLQGIGGQAKKNGFQNIFTVEGLSCSNLSRSKSFRDVILAGETSKLPDSRKNGC